MTNATYLAQKLSIPILGQVALLVGIALGIQTRAQGEFMICLKGHVSC